MPRRDVEIETADGVSPASLSVPEGTGPWPGILLFPDAGGLRASTSEMGERLSKLGYVVLVPEVYYREGPNDPPDMSTIKQPENKVAMEQIMARARRYDGECAATDGVAWADYLDSLPDVQPGPIGITGYCIGARAALNAAAQLGPRVAAVAAFHGSGLVRPEVPDSPHHRANELRGRVYVANAIDDDTHGWTPANEQVFKESVAEAGVPLTIETYPARHGYAIPDQYDYDAAADERHWQALERLFGSAFGS